MADSSSKRFIGEFLLTLPISTESRQRLAPLLNLESLPAQVLKKYAAGTKPYTETFEKKEVIAGFRPGTPAYNKKAIPKLIQYLNDPSNRNYDFHWSIYKWSVLDFITNDLPALKKLVTNLVISQADPGTRDILHLICENAFEFGVTVDDVTKFYELWWFERIEDFEEIRKLCLVQDEAKMQKKAISRLTDAVDTLGRELADLGQKGNTLSEKIQSAQDAIDSLSEVQADHSKKTDGISDSLQELDRKIDAQFARTTKADESKKSSIQDKVSGLNERLKAVEQIQKTSVTAKELKSEIKKSIAESVSELGQSIQASEKQTNEAIIKHFGGLRQELEEKFALFSKDNSKKKDAPASSLGISAKYESPLSPFISVPMTTPKITKELDFVNAWIGHLQRNEDVSLSFEQALAYHSLLIANNVTVVSDFPLVNSWVECLGWSPYTMHLVASATWTSEQDWGDGTRHVFQESTSPRFLVIHNYDAGLPECYLIPSLLLWSMQRAHSGWSKIFLVPSQSGNIPNYQILEFAAHIGDGDYLTPRNLGIRESLTINGSRQDTAMGVDPKVAKLWLKDPANIEFNLNSIQQALGIAISPRIGRGFRKSAGYAAKYLQDPFALGTAFHHQLLPWVHAKHGESNFSELGAFLKQLPDVRYW